MKLKYSTGYAYGGRPFGRCQRLEFQLTDRSPVLYEPRYIVVPRLTGVLGVGDAAKSAQLVCIRSQSEPWSNLSGTSTVHCRGTVQLLSWRVTYVVLYLIVVLYDSTLRSRMCCGTVLNCGIICPSFPLLCHPD